MPHVKNAMRTPREIRKYCERRYSDLLRAIVEGRSLFPLEIRFGKTNQPSDFESLRQAVTSLSESDLNFSIEWAERNTRRWGLQRLPRRIWFDDESGFVRALGKAKEVEHFRQNLRKIREECPELDGWLLENVKFVASEDGSWPELLKVCRYFLENPKPGLYIRQLPVSVDTKFVENHATAIGSLLDFLHAIVPPQGMRFEERYGLLFDQPLVRFRFLDEDWRQSHGFPVSDLSVTIKEFGDLPLGGSDVLVTENKMNFLTLPPAKRGIAIFGGGESVQLLGKVLWLRDCNLRYWGDIDAHGFAILSRLRSAFPAMESIMMNERTFDTFREAAVNGPPVREAVPANLTPEEEHLYNRVVAAGLRLEQEKISFPYAVSEIQK